MSKAKHHTVFPNNCNVLSVVNTRRPGRLTNQLQYLENEVLEELWNHEYSGPFQVLVDPVLLPVYYKVIKNPMDLSTIKKRLKNRYYKHAMECIQDFLSIFTNCFTFHKSEDEILLKGKTLQEIFLKKINKMPTVEFDITPKKMMEKQNRSAEKSLLMEETVRGNKMENKMLGREVSKHRSHVPDGFERSTSQNKASVQRDKDHTPCESLDSSTLSFSSDMTLGKNSRSSFCEPHYLTHEQSPHPKKMKTESQQEVLKNSEWTEPEKEQDEVTFQILRCGVEVSTPPDRKTAAERERLKKEAQIRRRIEADLNGFDLTLQSIIMAEFEEKYFQ